MMKPTPHQVNHLTLVPIDFQHRTILRPPVSLKTYPDKAADDDYYEQSDPVHDGYSVEI